MSKKRFEGWMTPIETASALGVSRRTLDRNLSYYKARGLVPVKMARNKILYRRKNVEAVVERIFEIARREV